MVPSPLRCITQTLCLRSIYEDLKMYHVEFQAMNAKLLMDPKRQIFLDQNMLAAIAELMQVRPPILHAETASQGPWWRALLSALPGFGEAWNAPFKASYIVGETVSRVPSSERATWADHMKESSLLLVDHAVCPRLWAKMFIRVLSPRQPHGVCGKEESHA